ncbi:MAG: single-stranded DNA-binding protein [Bacteroidetes bacterium]|nr:MAG: single-stranded DNA-binding protein [Bacteroidota bacterium]RLD84581.1 MAG: single-stranded DNA-binding protein [Bacteroidota bacterium]
MGVNKVILVGNVGKDPEVQYIKEDVPVARFTLATSETYKDRNGEKVTNTEWHNIVVWRGLAKVVENYVKKGSQLYIEGKISNRQYEKDGVTKYFTEIVANSLQMLGSKENTGTGAAPPPQTSTPTTVNEPKVEDIAEDIGGDDLPF